MKLLVCLFLMLVSSKECQNKKSSFNDSNNKKAEIPLLQDTLKIVYRASARGFFEVIQIEGDSIFFTTDYNLKKIDTVILPPEDKTSLLNLVNSIDINELTQLEPPSKTHQYDAAPAAFLKITKGDKEFMTPSFDHGNPPKTIKPLVDKILSLKTLFEKP